jgi:glycosyltransferase involved in cell wall biosynthesis
VERAGKKLRILAVLEAGDAYPSGRVRGLIYKDLFARDGDVIQFVSRLNVSFVRMMNAPPRWLRFLLQYGVLARLVERLGRILTARNERTALLMAKDFDVVYMSKVTSADFIDRMRGASTARLVLDFGDAIWLPRYRIERIDRLIKSADAVTTDNPYTAEYVRRFNANCTVVPDSPQTEIFDGFRGSFPKTGSNERIVIGWIGTRSTAYNLYVVWEALERLFARRTNIELRLVGAALADLPPFERVRYTCVTAYDQSRMIEEVLKMDIGLFPLQDVEACRVRGVLKATVYMSGEAVAVCSPVGQCRDLIEDGINGMLAATPEEWETKIERLIADESLRRSIAARGLSTVRTAFTMENSYRLLRTALQPSPSAMSS